MISTIKEERVELKKEREAKGLHGTGGTFEHTPNEVGVSGKEILATAKGAAAMWNSETGDDLKMEVGLRDIAEGTGRIVLDDGGEWGARLCSEEN